MHFTVSEQLVKLNKLNMSISSALQRNKEISDIFMLHFLPFACRLARCAKHLHLPFTVQTGHTTRQCARTFRTVLSCRAAFVENVYETLVEAELRCEIQFR